MLDGVGCQRFWKIKNYFKPHGPNEIEMFGKCIHVSGIYAFRHPFLNSLL